MQNMDMKSKLSSSPDVHVSAETSNPALHPTKRKKRPSLSTFEMEEYDIGTLQMVRKQCPPFASQITCYTISKGCESIFSDDGLEEVAEEFMDCRG